MINKDTRNAYRKKLISLSLVIGVFALLAVVSWKAVDAYYNTINTLSIFAGRVGDFDTGEGDINAIVYKLKDDKYVKINSVPAMGYSLNKVSCTTTCDTNSLSACYYSYNATTKKITLTSNKKVTCKFYFNPDITSDINVNILLEDSEGTYTYGNKHYRLSNIIPAYGYEYLSGTCDNGVTPTFNATTRKFTVVTGSKTTCTAYFTSKGDADIIVNVYVQEEIGEYVYKYVEAIPANNTYVLSTHRTSSCTTNRGTTGTAPTYVNGYINVNSTERETCNVYLDLAV